MTILEERFMNSLPSQLRDIALELRSIRSATSNPIIEFSDEHGNIHIEPFESMEMWGENRFLCNGYNVTEDQFAAVSKIIKTLPNFHTA